MLISLMTLLIQCKFLESAIELLYLLLSQSLMLLRGVLRCAFLIAVFSLIVFRKFNLALGLGFKLFQGGQVQHFLLIEIAL